jgi:hypothetical protein
MTSAVYILVSKPDAFRDNCLIGAPADSVRIADDDVPLAWTDDPQIQFSTLERASRLLVILATEHIEVAIVGRGQSPATAETVLIETPPGGRTAYTCYAPSGVSRVFVRVAPQEDSNSATP